MYLYFIDGYVNHKKFKVKSDSFIIKLNEFGNVKLFEIVQRIAHQLVNFVIRAKKNAI